MTTSTLLIPKVFILNYMSCLIPINTMIVESRHKCQHCNKTFSRKNHLIDHARTHSGGKNYIYVRIVSKTIEYFFIKETPFQCERCPKSFRTKQMRKTHTDRNCDESKTFVCYICNKTLKTLSSVINHVK